MLRQEDIGSIVGSHSSYRQPQLIDFFKSEMRLREEYRVPDRTQTYPSRPRNYPQSSWKSTQEKAGAQEVPAIAHVGQSHLAQRPKLSPHLFVDFLGVGDDPKPVQLPRAADSRFSSATDEVATPPMANLCKEAVSGQWPKAVVRPNMAKVLRILSPSFTATEGSGTSGASFTVPQTPTRDMEHGDHHYDSADGGSAFSADSGRFRVPDGNGNLGHDDQKLHKKSQKGEVGSSDRMCSADSSASHGRKRLRRLSGDHTPPMAELEPRNESVERANRDVSTLDQVWGSPPQTCGKLLQKDVGDEENDVVLQAATALVSLSSNEDDWRYFSSSDAQGVNRVEADEAERESFEARPEISDDAVVSSVLSRPSHKRRYRLVADLYAELPRV